MNEMRVWYNNTFTGKYPTGVCKIVVARSAHAAALALQEKLQQDVSDDDMKEVPLTGPRVIVVNDGDY